MVYKPSGNVLIRVHHQPRIKLFTPKDVGDCPVSVCRITPGRTTRVVSQQDGSKEDISDGWAGSFSAHRELPVFWTGITIFRSYSDAEHAAAALSAAGGLSPHEGNIPVSSGAAVAVSTASSTTLAETTKEKPSVFGNPCQLQGGYERPPLTVGNKRARKRLARDAVGPMFEFACSPNSSMGNVFKDLNIPHVRLAKEYIDLESAVADEQLAYQLSQCVRPNLWAAIPCVSGSPWQRLNLHRLGKPFNKHVIAKAGRGQM